MKYTPLQSQCGRLTVTNDRVTDPYSGKPTDLSAMVASIRRVAGFQTRAARSDLEADRAYVEAFGNADPEVVNWALGTAWERLKQPSPALADALLSRWPGDAGAVANAMVAWRLQRGAPLLAKTLTGSNRGEERAFAAMALGATGDVAYLSLLRRTAATDLDLRASTRLQRHHVDARTRVAWQSSSRREGSARGGARPRRRRLYNLLELNRPDPDWPPASNALISDVRAFLTEMQADPAKLVSINAKSMLSAIAQRQR